MRYFGEPSALLDGGMTAWIVSGVTACHNLFAMELAGLNGSHLYAGSWSEWITDPTRAIESDL